MIPLVFAHTLWLLLRIFLPHPPTSPGLLLRFFTVYNVNDLFTTIDDVFPLILLPLCSIIHLIFFTVY